MPRLAQIIVFVMCQIGSAPTNARDYWYEGSQPMQMEKKEATAVDGKLLPRVLIDQSHDFRFIVLHLGTFLKTHGFFGTMSHATLEPRIYRNCDIIVTHQSWSDVGYAGEQVKSLKEFVRNGGGLLLLGYGPGYVDYAKSKALAFDSWPINRLAGEFGFQFDAVAGRLPVVVQAHNLTEGVQEVTYEDKTPRLGTVTIPSEASVLLADSAGKAVLAVRTFGRGRVAVLTEYRFIKTIDETMNERIFVNLFEWLGAASPNTARFATYSAEDLFPGIELHKGHDYELVDKPEPPNWNGGPDYIWPEIQINRGAITLQYAASMKKRAEYIVEQYPRVYETIFDLFKVEPAREMIIEALPTAGGGYHWTREKLVAIGSLADDKAVVGIMGHEMVHGWGLPTPKNFPHGWTAFTDDYLETNLKLKPPEKIAEEWKQELATVTKVDPQLDSLDVTESTADPVRQRILDKKVGWMLKELEKKYGLAFFSRLAMIYRQRSPERIDVETYEDLPIDDFIYYASLAAAEDLYPWFQRLGTTVHPRKIE